RLHSFPTRRSSDLVAAGFDAGIHFGEFIERDMITFRVSKDHRPAIVGSHRYFEAHPKPVHPRDLTSHRCINFRHGSAGVYRWEFDKGKQSLTVAVNGSLIVDDVEIMVRAAIDGVGLAFMSEDRAAPRSEEHTSELQSLRHLVCRLLLEKKKKKK